MSTVLVYILCALGLYTLFKALDFYRLKAQLKGIPTVGPSSNLLSYITAYKFIQHGREIIQEGYTKYYGSAFKVAQMNGWQVIVSGPQMIEDLRRATDDQLSSSKTADDIFQTKYTLGGSAHHILHLISVVVRSTLTRNIGIQFPEVWNEIVTAFSDEVPLTKGWSKVCVTKSLPRIMSRTSNRLFVGLPLCRNPEYRDLNIDFTMDLMKTAIFLTAFPDFMKPLVAPLFTKVPAKIRKATRLLEPLIQERLDKQVEYGNDWLGKPNDVISWLIDAAPPKQRNVHDLAICVLFLNIGTLHNTSQGLMLALHYIAAYNEYVTPLREEIESVVNKEGWTKSALGKMRKLDSFLKETQRMVGVSGVTMIRTALKAFTFSDGTTLPAGTTVSAASYATHTDERNYPDAREFKGFRFAEMRVSKDAESLKHHMVTTNLDFLIFGHGKHACPGRFLAVNVLKAMFAHILTTYDVKFEDERTAPPPPTWFGMSIVPDQNAQLVFRARSS